VSGPQEGDDALMRRIAAGDEAAFRLLTGRHLGRLLRLAQQMLGSATWADDVVQEALLRIWMNAGRWRPERARLTTWFYTIVYRLCIDRLRTQRTVPLDLAMEAADPAPSTLEALAQAAELRQLAAAMQLLEPRQRAAVTLFYYEELSGPEAAAVLGLGLRAFWSLLHRARQTLRRHIEAPSPSSATVSP
jgi:RNA polymerase sigma-70 factor (ECF subfamily)